MSAILMRSPKKRKKDDARQAPAAKPPRTSTPFKILTLIRHAKSSWTFSGLADLDRPLNRRGQRDAPLMGRVLAARGFAPELFVTSPALRALRTAETIAAVVQYPEQRIVLDQRLYRAESADLIKMIRSVDDTRQWIAWVGHNPGLTDLVNLMVRERLDNVPTGGVVEMRFECACWADVGPDRLQAFDFDFPRRHPSS